MRCTRLGLLATGLAITMPVLAQLSLPPPPPPAVRPPPVPASTYPPSKAAATAPIKPSQFVKPTRAAPAISSPPLLQPQPPTTPPAQPTTAESAVPLSSTEVERVDAPATPVTPAGTAAQESAVERPSPFATSEEITAQRKACSDLKFATSAWAPSYGSASTSFKGKTKAQVNCIMAAQPSVDWVRATLGGGNTVVVSVDTNNTTQKRTATIRVATAHTSVLLEVEQAGNPSEFLPL